MDRRTLISAARWLPAVAWAGVIFGASSLPGSSIPGGLSVYGHLGEYAVLGALVVWAHRTAEGRRAVLVALAVCAVYGASDELHQAFVPMRTPDVLDWLTDLVGATLGALAATGVLGAFDARAARQ